MNEQHVIKRGFNDGYTIQQNNPELAVKIARSFSDPAHPYAKGFIGGSIQRIKEQGQVEELQQERNKNKTPERDI